MLKDRLRTSAVLITIILGLLYLDGHHSTAGAEGLWLLPLLLFFALGTARDMAMLLRGSQRLISPRVTLFATAIVTLSACLPLLWPLFGEVYPQDCPVGRLGWTVIGAVAAMFVVLISEMTVYGIGPAGTIERTSHAVFVSLYAGLPMALLVSLRAMGSGNWGLAALITMILVTKSTDAGAYFTGKAIGKSKLIPRLSPGKTKEGAIGGIVTATTVAYVCLTWLFPAVAGDGTPPSQVPAVVFLANPIWGALVLGPLLALSGMIGDLAESLVKRDCEAKDSGNWLPGLGGVWDVTDSLIAAIAPAFLCFAAGVAG
ncbi:MAG: phosphatidate cytidylyltransferase [Planctomycetaceae bacterium]|nr:phosphatidate cytidylyltransferase [Planctomycetaceae bacterium]